MLPAMEHLRRTGCVLALAAATVGAVSGCAQWGAAVLEDNHVAFNSAVAEAMDRQLLINLVRLSRRRPTQWLTVSIINVQSTVGAQVGTSDDGVLLAPTGTSAGIFARTDFEYTPNITFLPKQGEQLAREMMSPIPVSSLENMVSAGYSVSAVLMFCVESVQGIEGIDFSIASGAKLVDPRYGRMLRLIDGLSRRHLVSLSLVPKTMTWNPVAIKPEAVTLERIVEARKVNAEFVPREDGAFDYAVTGWVPVITLNAGIESDAEGAELCKLLGIQAAPGSVRLVGSEEMRGTAVLGVRTRSFNNLLQLLSLGVEREPGMAPPPEKLDSPEELYSAMPVPSVGQELQEHMRAVFRVHCGTALPPDAEITVKEGGRWYWISSTDTSTLLTFSMLRDLYDLQVKSEGYPGPVLTLPVGTGR
jgi:hypothetical protein